eukprot:TRINITY_DN47159_c0_g1_i1.p1 TRINITY_DN47159_c0_g1~~TRINITY_DN47159_c0_g1_i1.p1  ORF type:complete len:484 (-),score=126.09 TRINITY_DN47159_c0_g1_i1:200-1651(-)
MADDSMPSTTLFVSGLPPDTSSDILMAVLGEGTVSCNVLPAKASDPMGPCVALLRCADQTSADNIRNNMNGQPMPGFDGYLLTVKYANQNFGQSSSSTASPMPAKGYGKSDKGDKGKKGPYGGGGGGGYKGGGGKASPSDTLMFRGLPIGCDANSVTELVSQFGTVANCQMQPAEPNAMSAKAVVKFNSIMECMRVKDNFVVGAHIEGSFEPLVVEYYKPPVKLSVGGENPAPTLKFRMVTAESLGIDPNASAPGKARRGKGKNGASDDSGWQNGGKGGCAGSAYIPPGKGYDAGKNGGKNGFGKGFDAAGIEGNGQGFDAAPGGGKGFDAGMDGGKGFDAGLGGGKGFDAGMPGGMAGVDTMGGGKGFDAGMGGGDGMCGGKGFDAGMGGAMGGGMDGCKGFDAGMAPGMDAGGGFSPSGAGGGMDGFGGAGKGGCGGGDAWSGGFGGGGCGDAGAGVAAGGWGGCGGGGGGGCGPGFGGGW